MNTFRLYPFTFEEFLWSQDEDRLVDMITEHCNTFEKLPLPFHSRALELFKTYIIVGGMPASILKWNETRSYLDIPTVLSEIITNYRLDMSKYASKSDVVKIRATFDSIPSQLAKENKKFQYSVVKPGGNARKFETAINWLEYAGLILKCNNVQNAIIPLKVYENTNLFKVYLHDTGILTLLSRTPYDAVLRLNSADYTFLGALAENYVATALNYAGLDLHYWTSPGKAEVDFLLQSKEEIIPIEVKKGVHTRSKSLTAFNERYRQSKALRISAKNFGRKDGLMSIPLYAVEWWLKNE